MGVSNNMWGSVLAASSSLFIGASFLLKKKALKRATADDVIFEPVWWAGMITMIFGEVANLVAFLYAPVVLVTLVGALTITISAVLAHFMLKQHRLRVMGTLGCLACIVGSIIIVIHAPRDQHTPSTTSVQEIWYLAAQPGFLIVLTTQSAILLLRMRFVPLREELKFLFNKIVVLSVAGLVHVVSTALGVEERIDQIGYVRTGVFVSAAAITAIVQNAPSMELDNFDSYITMRSLVIGCLASLYFK